MLINNSIGQQSHQIKMLTFARDFPNICSLTGLFCAFLSIYFAIMGNFQAAIIGMAWAVFFDWGDGIIARHMKDRTHEHRAFGGQLDSLIDIVSFGICPAVLLLSYGKFSPWFIPGAFVIVAAAAIRLSYFNVFGLVDDSTYMGLALDNNVIILSFVFLFEGIFSHGLFAAILYILLMAFSVLNLAPIKTPKFSGRWFYILMVYTIGITAIYAWILWRSA